MSNTVAQQILQFNREGCQVDNSSQFDIKRPRRRFVQRGLEVGLSSEN